MENERELKECEPSQICNLSRIPIPMEENPCYITALELLANPEIAPVDTRLFAHYLTFEPKTLADIYNSRDSVLKEYPASSNFLPWIHTRPSKKYQDIAFFGPTTFQHVIKQIDTLKNLIESIQEHGYVPEKFPDRKLGEIRAYYLDYARRKVYVVSGNHRVAVLCALGIQIRFGYEKKEYLKPRDLEHNGWAKGGKYPAAFSGDAVSKWPSVRSGFLKEAQALKILEKYIEQD